LKPKDITKKKLKAVKLNLLIYKYLTNLFIKNIDKYKMTACYLIFI